MRQIYCAGDRTSVVKLNGHVAIGEFVGEDARVPAAPVSNDIAGILRRMQPRCQLYCGGLRVQANVWEVVGLSEPYLSIKNRSATRTLFLRPYLAHFCPVFSRFFAVFSVLKPGFQKVAPKDRGAFP